MMKKISLRNDNSRDEDCVIDLNGDSSFAYKESYNILRTNVIFSLKSSQKSQKTIAISSAVPGEGKSSISSNLGISLSKSNCKVIVIDADMRNPSQHKNFKVPNKQGLSDVIAGNVEFEKAVIKIDENLDLLTGGVIPPNPSELLGSTHMDQLIKKLETIYDYIVIDTPPILLVTDALVLQNKCAGMILVVRIKKTYYKDVGKALECLKKADFPVLGTVAVGVGEENSIYKRLGRKVNGRYEYNYGQKA